MSLPTFRQLTCLIAVADTGRFKLAAERVHISQPALSEQIAQLEHNLGIRLFERGRHGARLTPMGAEIVERARRLLADLNELQDAVAAGSRNLGGLIRLGALPTVGPYLMPRVVPDLHESHPDLRLYVREMRTVDLETELRSGGFDVLLSTPPDESEGLVVEPLFREALRLGLPAGHPLTRKKRVAVADLAGENLLTLERGHYLSQRVRELAESARAELQLEYEGTSLDGLRQMIGMGMGLSIFPGLFVVSSLANDPAVEVRPIALEEDWRWIALVWRATSPRAADFGALAELLRARAGALLAPLGLKAT